MLHLVRHGRVVEHLLDGSENPGLSAMGRLQAQAVSAVLEADYLASSPLQRAIETAEPISIAHDLDVMTVPAVGEVVPPHLDGEDRRAFLQVFMTGAWADQPDELRAWRDGVLEAMRDLDARGGHVVVVSHYVAINVAAGAAMGDDRTTVFHPDNTSVNDFTLGSDGRLEVVALNQVTHLAELQ